MRTDMLELCSPSENLYLRQSEWMILTINREMKAFFSSHGSSLLQACSLDAYREDVYRIMKFNGQWTEEDRELISEITLLRYDRRQDRHEVSHRGVAQSTVAETRVLSQVKSHMAR